MHYLLIILFSFFYHSSSNSVVLIEVVNEDREYIPTVIEIQRESEKTDEQVISRIEASTAVRTSLTKAGYKIRLISCEHDYYVKTKIFKSKHHLVFVLDDQDCRKSDQIPI
ncbi:hypothetical protein [Sediminitomix flava]|uniref:Uncharacterized protein n=1 Tax=Sediminitomix flava TaxID=379075 RepID=A0A315ZEM1_SEDFL|nr:hypothetical protein [Sediminitomix flava]PWJ43981.1 hypothetical protein BC781_101331 [Sediminitomix flava]